MSEARFEYLEIHFDQNSATYSAGDYVTGAVVFSLGSPVRVASIGVEVKGLGSTRWMNKTSEKVFSKASTYLHHYLPLDISGSRKTTVPNKQTVRQTAATCMPAGQHVIPFSFPLPYNIPSSIEAEYGSIVYTVTAHITAEKARKSSVVEQMLMSTAAAFGGGSSAPAKRLFRGNSDASEGSDGNEDTFKQETKFWVLARVDLSGNIECKRPIEVTEGVYFTALCCLNRGSVTATLKMSRLGFRFDQAIPVSAYIENNSDRFIKNVSAKLMQHVRFYGESDFREIYELKEIKNLITMFTKPGIEPRSSQTWNSEQLSDQALLPTQTGFAVNVEYTIILDVDPGPTIELPLIIGTLGTSPIQGQG